MFLSWLFGTCAHARRSPGHKLFELTAKFFSPSDCVFQRVPWERDSLERGVLCKRDHGCTLCTGYQEGMRPTKDSPSWLWKSMRKHLAKGDGGNKAGRVLCKGTISLARKEKRKHLQPGYQADTESPIGPTYDWNPWNSCERECVGWEDSQWADGTWSQPRRHLPQVHPFPNVPFPFEKGSPFLSKGENHCALGTRQLFGPSKVMQSSLQTTLGSHIGAA